MLRWPQLGGRPQEAQVEKAVVEEIGGRVNKVEKKYLNSKTDFDKNFQGSISFWTKLSPTSETVEKPMVQSYKVLFALQLNKNISIAGSRECY